MEVTVLTPTIAGREALLADAVRSVAAQTVPARHLIEVDVAREGPAAVRNRLLEAATTDRVAFLDDDDTLDACHLERLLAVDAEIIYSYCRFEGRDPLSNVNRPFNARRLHRGPNFIPVTVVADRKALLAAGGFHGRFEDWELWKAVDRAGGRIACVAEVTWSYRFLGANRTDE